MVVVSRLSPDSELGGVLVWRPSSPMVIPLWYHHLVDMTLRLTEEDERILARLAEDDGISRQEATIRAIHEVAARRGHMKDVADASARARARYADVLDRLGR